MREGVDVVDHDPGGRIGLVFAAGREEVDGGTRMTGSWNFELVPTFGLESAAALLENATVARTGRLTHRPLSRIVPRRSEHLTEIVRASATRT